MIPPSVGWLDAGAARMAGWTLLHSLWLGAILAAMLAVSFRVIPPVSAHLRHRTALLVLTILLSGTAGIGAYLLGDWRVHAGCWKRVENPRGLLVELPRHCVHHVGSGLAPSPAIAPASAARLELEPRRRVEWTGRQGAATALERNLALGTRLLGLDRAGARVRSSLIGASRWIQVGLTVWALVVAVLLVRLLGDFLALRRAVRRGARLDDPAVSHLLERLASELEIGRPVDVRLVPNLDSPGLVGWRRPVLLLPTDLHRVLSPAELEPILAHELVHVRRRDYPLNLLQQAVEILFFFNPFLRWISDRLRMEREAARDREAIRSGATSARRYVAGLLAAETRRDPRYARAGVLHHGAGELLGRVRRLASNGTGLHGRAPRGEGSRRAVVATGVGAVCLVTAILAYEVTSLTSFTVMAVDVEERDPRTEARVLGS